MELDAGKVISGRVQLIIANRGEMINYFLEGRRDWRNSQDKKIILFYLHGKGDYNVDGNYPIPYSARNYDYDINIFPECDLFNFL